MKTADKDTRSEERERERWMKSRALLKTRTCSQRGLDTDREEQVENKVSSAIFLSHYERRGA